ncbi:hypothetical protein GIB67_025370 [Kingdonia uniflora]|uniref:Uncharacterized protein n=1 Tax=Kingdonia uniflora TaxID=39325 RepID=A0A7J7NBW5_9MAGN|nr:hypothetical protein GIB67_025370 [Kingdonia uniflora]
MLKTLSASGTTGSGEVIKEKRGRVEPSGDSGEKVAEGRSTTVDDIQEVEERARLAALHEEKETSKMVARFVKGIWLGVEEDKSELKRMKIELERKLARAKADAVKELQAEARVNLEEMAEENDRLGYHLMLMVYSEEEVDAIKADTYIEDEEDEGMEEVAVGVFDGLDDVSRQTVSNNQGDKNKLPVGENEKAAGTQLEIFVDLGQLTELWANLHVEAEKRTELKLQLIKDHELREKELNAERQAHLKTLKRHKD